MKNKIKIIDENKFIIKRIILRRLIMNIYIFKKYKRIF